MSHFQENQLLSLLFTVASAVNTTLSVEYGTTAVLECPIFPDQVYPSWRGPPDLTTYTGYGHPTRNPYIAHINRVSWSANHKDLVLSNVTRVDEGNYKCLQFNYSTNVYGAWSIQLNIKSKYTIFNDT